MRMPGADARLAVVGNYGSFNGPRPRVVGMVLHTAVGSYAGTEGWQADPRAHVSSYFITGQNGSLDQAVDTDLKAWTQGAGNEHWIGVENEGNPSTPLTGPQLTTVARIYAWLVHNYGIPLQITDDPVNGAGLGWHGMGAGVWESPGHPLCPGEIIKAQRGEILRQAALMLNQPSSPAAGPAKEEAMELIVDYASGAKPNRSRTVYLDVPSKCLVLRNGLSMKGDVAFGANTRIWQVPTDQPVVGCYAVRSAFRGALKAVVVQDQLGRDYEAVKR